MVDLDDIVTCQPTTRSLVVAPLRIGAPGGLPGDAKSDLVGQDDQVTNMARRAWVPEQSEQLVSEIAAHVARSTVDDVDQELLDLAAFNRRIHHEECINLNPAANVMNPRAEALLASGLGSRPSLGYPGDKYEMGLEAIERVEVIAAELACEVFNAAYAEVRVGSGALANLYAFMAATKPHDSIIVPAATIGGHVTHHTAGAAGLYGATIHEAPADAAGYTVDLDRLRDQALAVRPAMITIGGSLNLAHHPVREIRSIADEIGAIVLFDAAHLSGLIAGGAWPNPLDEGAHVMTMSTYKSLAGPPAGLLVTNDATIAERVDAIAFPGLTANFDAANTAALAMTLLDWKSHGHAYATEMVRCAQALAAELDGRGVAVHGSDPFTASHAFALDVGERGGHATAQHLRRANLLTSAIGLPHDAAAGLRIGTNEIVRWGLTSNDMPRLADLLTAGLRSDDLSSIAHDVTAFRRRFDSIRFVRDVP